MVHPSQFTAETLKDYDGPSYTIRASSVGGQIIEVAMTYFNTTCYFFGDGDEPHPLDHVWIAYSEDISVGARVKAEGNEDLLDTLQEEGCLLYTSDAADERSSVDLGGRRIIKKKTQL